MKVLRPLLWLLTLAAAFALGRHGALSEAQPRGPAAFRAGLEARDELTRAHFMTGFLADLDPGNLPAALQLLEEHQVGVTRDEVRWLMLAWSRFDAPGAFAWARAWPTPWKRILMNQAAYAWSHRDGAAALAAAESIEDEAQRELLVAAVMEGWLRGEDRRSADAVVARIADPKRRGRLIFRLAGETFRDGREALVRWAEAVPPDAPNDFKQGAFYHAATVLANADPEAAARWFEAHATRPYAQGALAGIARKWAHRHEPSALFAWLLSLPIDAAQEGERAEAVADGFRVWLNRDEATATAWLEAATGDPRLDPAIGELVLRVGDGDPERAYAWITRIQDEALRQERTVLLVRAWLRRDPEAASAWLADADLDASLRAQIRESPRDRLSRRASSRNAQEPSL